MGNSNYYCIIMAGGMGRRFWPYSRKSLPKQFIDFFGSGQTLLQQTYERYRRIIPPENIFITTHCSYKELVMEQLPEIREEQLVIEEEQRNTAPAIAYASHIIQKINPNACTVVAPSDHLILKTENFERAILHGLEFASKSDKLITIGIKPTRPETGYGYIQIDEEKEEDFYKVKTFIEKPALEFAEIFVQSNEFYWVDGLMLEQFPHIVDVDFSAEMEKKLDQVESGKADWRQTVDDFYKGFDASLQAAEKNMEGKKVKVPDEPSSEVCDLCGRPMVIKVGRYGKFLACTGFPECRGTKRLVKDTGGICPKCGQGRLLERKSAKGRIYYGCEKYPDCDFMTWDTPVPTKCEKCGTTLFRKGSKLYCAKEGCGFEMPVPKNGEK